MEVKTIITVNIALTTAGLDHGMETIISPFWKRWEFEIRKNRR